MEIISGAAVSEVALAESLIGARAVASKANGSFSGRVLKYYCCFRGCPDTCIDYDLCIIRILLLGDFRLGDCREETTKKKSQQ